ncbi:unnamed protein product, partial [Linum tenue]
RKKSVASFFHCVSSHRDPSSREILPPSLLFFPTKMDEGKVNSPSFIMFLLFVRSSTSNLVKLHIDQEGKDLDFRERESMGTRE